MTIHLRSIYGLQKLNITRPDMLKAVRIVATATLNAYNRPKHKEQKQDIVTMNKAHLYEVINRYVA